MEIKKSMLTYDGLKKLEIELETLKTVRRKEVAEKIKEARSQGDLSENAEYDAAKDEQAEIELKIIELEKLLRNVEVIDEDILSDDIVGVGNKVVLYDKEFKENVSYTIVGSAEADPMQGLLSNESPLGSSLIGGKVGDEVEVDAPYGKIMYEIKEIVLQKL